jgi:hypothetical protein
MFTPYGKVGCDQPTCHKWGARYRQASTGAQEMLRVGRFAYKDAVEQLLAFKRRGSAIARLT